MNDEEALTATAAGDSAVRPYLGSTFLQARTLPTSKTTLIEYHMVKNLTLMSFDLFCLKSARLWL